VIRNGLSHFFTAEGANRFSYYPVTGDPPNHWTPTLWVDGTDEYTLAAADVAKMWSIYTNMVSTRRAVPSPLALNLEVEYGAKNDSGTVHVQVVATEPISFDRLHLRMAIIEDSLSYLGNNYDQILRDYLPDEIGFSFSISQGDTFAHSEDMAIDSAWVAEHCKIVAFVQEDDNREVLQAIQGPVLAPVPDEVADLTAILVENDLRLEWSPVAVDTGGHPIAVDSYQIYRDTTGFFGPGSDPYATATDTFFVDDSGVVGDTGTEYYYLVTAVAGYKESGYSELVGEFDRYLATGK
jgi:hypothetical protein